MDGDETHLSTAFSLITEEYRSDSEEEGEVDFEETRKTRSMQHWSFIRGDGIGIDLQYSYSYQSCNSLGTSACTTFQQGCI